MVYVEFQSETGNELGDETSRDDVDLDLSCIDTARLIAPTPELAHRRWKRQCPPLKGTYFDTCIFCFIRARTMKRKDNIVTFSSSSFEKR